MKAVRGTLVALSLLAVLVWGNCAKCFDVAAEHACCKRSAQPPCHSPKPEPAHNCGGDCANHTSANLASARPESSHDLASPIPVDAAGAVAAVPLPVPDRASLRRFEPVARSGPEDLYLVNRVLLI